MRFTRRRALGLLLGLTAAACASPTIPLPPPDRPDVEGPDREGMVTVSGYVPPKSLVFAINRRTDEVAGQLTEGDGLYSFRIAAEVGDVLSISYISGTDQSPSTEVRVEGPAEGGSAGAAGGGGAAGAGPSGQ